MFSYKVVKETREVSQIKRRESWTESEIISAYNNLSYFDPEILFESADKEEALAFFEEEKKNCRSWYEKTFIGLYVLIADVLTLEEIELDDDGELLCCGACIDQAAEALTIEEEDEDEEEEEEEEDE